MKEIIKFPDFEKLDIRIGKILTAEKVEGADKLLKLEVDFASEKRQIVAGLAPYFKPEELVGKECPFLVNLEPRKLRGLESEGMILVAGMQSPTLLTPEKEVEVGAVVG
ncbi:MAG: methionine--tRNA ligase subunit beta [Candidatus Aenigmarchaeota archaeon]|nr:methionine--tRNA ligase subunit beta [Candidatus Aenigmarchaeota archaeon]